MLICFLFIASKAIAGNAVPLLEKGWDALAKDKELEALEYFGEAYLIAEKENDTADKAQSLLYLGIINYSVSYSQGLFYCLKAMDEYKKMEGTNPGKALEGRSRCLQLASTIRRRQGDYKEAIQLSQEALQGLIGKPDTAGYTGLIYNNIGRAYHGLQREDSAAYYHRLALNTQLSKGNITYLPISYIEIATIETGLHHKEISLALNKRGLAIADSKENQQAKVAALLSMGNWHIVFEKNFREAASYFQKAEIITKHLNDPSFKLEVIQAMLSLSKQTGQAELSIAYLEKILLLKDNIYTRDRQKELKSLEIQFEVSQKDRQLKQVQQEKENTLLINYLLSITISVLVLLSAGIIIMLRRVNMRDNQLLTTQQALTESEKEQKQLIEAQRQLKEQQMQQALEFKESQLSALTIQMLQKNELLQELQQRLENNTGYSEDQTLHKIINKGLNQDKEWSDFNSYFESINQHFYVRLKNGYPEISPNDLKICALIKLNLSIKEMAAILNISPDSVKTARYRLRKKLQLNNEDNLTAFIMNL